MSALERARDTTEKAKTLEKLTKKKLHLKLGKLMSIEPCLFTELLQFLQ